MSNVPANIPSNTIEFNEREIMPFGKIGAHINWQLVFKEKTGVSYPEAINRNTCTNESGDFDVDAFILSRSWQPQKREEYNSELEQNKRILSRLKERLSENKLDILNVEYFCEKILEIYQKMYFLGEGDGSDGDKTYYRNQDFYHTMEGIYASTKGNALAENAHTFTTLLNDINNNIIASQTREEKQYNKIITNLKEYHHTSVKKYQNDDNTLNVNGVLEALHSGRDYNEEALLTALYTCHCSKEDLTKLQQGAIEALNSKIKRLDTFKVFKLLQWVLPHIFEGYNFTASIPEIFRPEYLNHISVYNLTLESFIHNVHTRGSELGWSDEIQQKLIEQFKEFGQSENGKIGFGQGSEQLRYRQRATGGFRPDNISHYLIKEDMGESKKPTPKILQTKSHTTEGELAQTLIGSPTS